MEYQLLQDTAHARDGRQRISTPHKTAIMTLSSSYKKRCLGKQQQLLTDIAKRCREQEVSDLCSSITRKVNLAESPAAAPLTVGSTVDSSSSPRGKLRSINKPESDSGMSTLGGAAPSVSTESTGTDASTSGRSNTMFPQRKVLRSPRKDTHVVTGLPRLHISYRKGVTPSDSYHHKAVVLNQQQINGQIQLHHYIQPRADQLAPLVLPNIQYLGLDNNSVSTYMQARQLKISVAPRKVRAQIRLTARGVSTVQQ